MLGGNLNVEVVSGTVEGRTFRGAPHRRATVLLRFGKHSISYQAFKLGAILMLFQVLDGLLTYIGLYLHGVEMEGNAFLRSLMEAYGLFAGLFGVKITALILALGLMIYSHKRKWFRPIIFGLCAIYLCLAVLPWVYIISNTAAVRSKQTPVPAPATKLVNTTTVIFRDPGKP